MPCATPAAATMAPTSAAAIPDRLNSAIAAPMSRSRVCNRLVSRADAFSPTDMNLQYRFRAGLILLTLVSWAGIERLKIWRLRCPFSILNVRENVSHADRRVVQTNDEGVCR
ncbi:exported hypothetical protein [uncultured Mycobacterium sp.]|uniref:Uncharacterized protein n=1 Tax=uncultured Mycobacterium sp. TaxID=171292 RepID=A0A1Y5PJX5_9MYCO|nr:exported hypothetical protein [uncultured Mycobacterium sp.]